jgi:hypothetical protein
VVTRFDGYGELSRQQRGKRFGFKYCAIRQRLTLPTFSSGQTSSVTIVAVAYCSAASTRLDQLIMEPERLMATLIHRGTVPLAYWITLDGAGCRTASFMDELVNWQKRVLTERLQGRSKRSDFKRCLHEKYCSRACVDVFPYRCYRFPATCSGLAIHVICDRNISCKLWIMSPLAIPDIASFFHCPVVV